MPRTVFFSFHYDRDAWRAAQVRGAAHLPSGNARGRFRDGVAWESVRRQSEAAIRRWIDDQLLGTGVTVVLVGQETASRPFVRYEIEQSRRRGNGMLGVRVHSIPSYVGPNMTVDRPGPDPFAAVSDPLRPGFTLAGLYPTYDWEPSGRAQLASWIDAAARAVGR